MLVLEKTNLFTIAEVSQRPVGPSPCYYFYKPPRRTLCRREIFTSPDTVLAFCLLGLSIMLADMYTTLEKIPRKD